MQLAHFTHKVSINPIPQRKNCELDDAELEETLSTRIAALEIATLILELMGVLENALGKRQNKDDYEMVQHRYTNKQLMRICQSNLRTLTNVLKQRRQCLPVPTFAK
jgi:hypothetical protein